MTSATNPKTVELYGYGCQHEASAAAAILPGMLVERAGGEVQPHGAAGGPANSHFAVEYGMTGGSVDDEYEIGDNVLFSTYTPGSGVYSWIADGVNAAADAFLASNGDGTLKVAAANDRIVAQALEAVDNTAGGAPARIRIEVLISAVASA